MKLRTLLLALPATLALSMAPAAASAQTQVGHPFFGLGINGGLFVPDRLVANLPGRSNGLPFGLLLGGDLRLRFAQRLMVRAGVSYAGFSAQENLGELDATFMTQPVRYNYTFIPMDLGLRVDVIPVEGPVALWVGAAARATVVAWNTVYENVSSLNIDHGAGFTFGAYPEVALEFTWMRRRSFEIYARYDIGILSGATGDPGLRFHDVGAIGGPEIGIAAHLYF